MNASPTHAPPGQGHGASLITAGSLVALAILIGIAMLSYRSITSFQNRARWVDHTNEVLRTTELIFSDLKDAETAVRGYAITGDESYLEPLHDSSVSIPQRLQVLAGLTADNPTQSARSRELADLAKQRLDAAERTLRLFQRGNRAPVSAEARAHLDAGKTVMDGIRERVAQIRLEEESLLQERAKGSERAARKTIAIIIFGNLVGLSILAFAFGLLRREVLNRARAQGAAQQLAAEIEDLYERAPCGYHSVNRDGVFVHMNSTELAWLGYTVDEVIGKLRFLDVVAPEFRQVVQENFPRLLQGGTTDNIEYELVRKDGSRFPVSVNATAVVDEEGRFIMSRTTMFDISALNAARSQLVEANAFLDTVVENIPSMIFVKHADSLRFARINRTEEIMLGMPREQVVGKSDYDLFPKEQADFFTAKDREVLASREVVDIQQEAIRTPHGERILHTLKIGLRDASDNPQYLLGISHDITERIQAEERIRALAADLEVRANQLETANKELESFSYSVSHDLRSPLRAIDGFSRLLEEDYQQVLDAEGKRLLSVIRQNSQRMGVLIDDLLAFSKLGRKTLAVDRIDMNELVAEALVDVRAAAPATTAEVRLGDLPAATGDRVLLRQAWINLISNGIKYSSKKDKPEVVIGSRPGENGSIVYFVQDNGVGFDMQYYDKLFGVFQRLHRAEEFPGTGVGLAIVQRVVARHGGRAWAEAQPDKGATFYFSIPEGGPT